LVVLEKTTLEVATVVVHQIIIDPTRQLRNHGGDTQVGPLIIADAPPGMPVLGELQEKKREVGIMEDPKPVMN
jgi:hypothetical protein